jgi:U3 small nucleolar RNA-associated protein 15
MRRKKKLQTYEQHLKAFEYKAALTSALATKNPEVIVALIEELVERSGLYVAVANRSEEELCQLLEFLIWKVGDYRYSNILVEVARIILNIYAGVIGLSDKVDYRLFKDLEREVRQ